MRRLWAWLALLFTISLSAPAVAWPVHGVASGGGGSSPNVLPGAVSGSCVLTDSCTYSAPTTTYAGSSGDTGYTLPAVARWATPQRIEVGYAGVSTSRQIGINAFHQPTDAQVAGGFDDNVCSVDITIDGGATYTITGPTWNAADLETDWNFTATNSNFSDGYHRVDAVVKPCTGPSLVLAGPLEYSTSNHSGDASTGADTGSGVTISGNTLTVNSPGTFAVNQWRVGWDVMAIGVEHNTRITALGTGTGGAGTYTVSGPAQTVGTAVPATGGAHKSFWFFTNYNGTLGRNVEYVSATGTDGGTHGDSAADPVLHIGAAAARLWARNTNNRTYGGVICVVGNGTFQANGATGNRLQNYYGYAEIVGAESDARCGVSGTVASRTITTDTGANSSAGNFSERWAYLNVNGALEASFATWADHLTTQGFGVNWRNSGHQEGLLVFAATACTNNVIVGYYAGCRGEIVRNNTMDFITEDFIHGATTIIGNTFRDGGAVWLRVTGTVTSGSNVITGVSVPTGFTISQLFATGTAANAIDLNDCLSYVVGPDRVDDGYISAVDDAAHTITLKSTIDGSNYNAFCTSTGSLVAFGVHGDAYQFQSGLTFGNVIILNNDADDATIGYQQGLFAEVPVDGLVYKGNRFRSLLTSEYYINIIDGQFNWTHSGNAWNEQDSSTSGFNLRTSHSYWLDMTNACTGTPVGGVKKTYTPAGTNIRTSGGSCR